MKKTLFAEDWLEERRAQHAEERAEKSETSNSETRWIAAAIVTLLIAAAAIGAVVLGGGL